MLVVCAAHEDPSWLCAQSLVTCCTARGLARRALLSCVHVPTVPVRRALPCCQTLQPKTLPALLPPSAAQLSCMLVQLPQCLPQRLLCMCGCQGQPCDSGCPAAVLIDPLAGMQPPGQPDTWARLLPAPHTRLRAVQRAAAKVRRQAAVPPVVGEGCRSSSAQPGTTPLSPRLPACSPPTPSLAGIPTPAAASARRDGLAARAATPVGTEELASEGERSGKAQPEEQHGGASNANRQSTAAETEEEVSDELQADIQVRKSATTSQLLINALTMARCWLGLLWGSRSLRKVWVCSGQLLSNRGQGETYSFCFRMPLGTSCPRSTAMSRLAVSTR